MAGSAAGREMRPEKGQCMLRSLPEQTLRGLKEQRPQGLQGREAMEAGLLMAQVNSIHAMQDCCVHLIHCRNSHNELEALWKYSLRNLAIGVIPTWKHCSELIVDML